MEGRMEGKRTKRRRRVGLSMIQYKRGEFISNLEEEGTRPSWLEELDTRDLPDGRALLIDLSRHNYYSPQTI